MSDEEKIISEMWRLFKKGHTNPSLIALTMYHLGFEGVFGELRKLAIYQYQKYTIEEAEKRKIDK